MPPAQRSLTQANAPATERGLSCYAGHPPWYPGTRTRNSHGNVRTFGSSAATVYALFPLKLFPLQITAPPNACLSWFPFRYRHFYRFRGQVQFPGDLPGGFP